MAGKKSKLWFGFLEAGSKGSPVVRDDEIDTGHPRTLYLFNFMKGKILEYQRDIVEIKLRELNPEELTLIPELRTAYAAVREGFTPRATRTRRVVRRVKPAEPVDEVPDFDDVDDASFDIDFPLMGDGDDEAAAAEQLD